jgi:hypothetical protein
MRRKQESKNWFCFPYQNSKNVPEIAKQVVVELAVSTFPSLKEKLAAVVSGLPSWDSNMDSSEGIEVQIIASCVVF